MDKTTTDPATPAAENPPPIAQDAAPSAKADSATQDAVARDFGMIPLQEIYSLLMRYSGHAGGKFNPKALYLGFAEVVKILLYPDEPECVNVLLSKTRPTDKDKMEAEMFARSLIWKCANESQNWMPPKDTTETIADELLESILPCPNCGGAELRIRREETGEDLEWEMFVECKGCGTRSKGFLLEDWQTHNPWSSLAVVRAVNAWNNPRKPAPPPAPKPAAAPAAKQSAAPKKTGPSPRITNL